MYGELGLIESFSQCGTARSAWRMSVILYSQQKEVDARRYRAEAEKTRLLRGGDPTKHECGEDDFNTLLNYMDT